MNNRKILLTAFIFSLVGFYLLNYYTDLAIDDFSYKNIITNNPEKEGQRVRNFSDLLESQQNHYFITNGRLLTNGLAQLFLISDNKTLFDIVNTLIFGLLQILVLLAAGIKRKELAIPFYIFSLVVLWLLLPGPNHTLLWLTGSMNYLWAIVLVLCFYVIWQKVTSPSTPFKIWWYPVLFLTGIIAGASHEVMSVGVSGALFFYYVFNFKTFRGAIIPLVTGFFIGTLFIVIAPGNLVRLNSGNAGDSSLLIIIAQRIWGFFTSYKSMAALMILFISLLVLFFKRRKEFSVILKRHQILLLSILFSLIFIFLAGSFQPRVFFGVGVFSIIVLLSIIWQYQHVLNKKGLKILTYGLAIIMLVEISLVTTDLRANKKVFDKDEITWRTSSDNVFEFREKRRNRFVSYGLGGYDRYFWSNMVMSWYYGKEYMIFLPSDLYHDLFLSGKMIQESNLVNALIAVNDTNGWHLYRTPGSNFFVLPLYSSFPEQIERGAHVILEPLAPIKVQSLDIRQKVIRIIYKKLPQPVTSENIPCYVLKTVHGKYLYFKSLEKIPVDRLKSISIYTNSNQSVPSIRLLISFPNS